MKEKSKYNGDVFHFFQKSQLSGNTQGAQYEKIRICGFML